jgi:hypothetical protein
MIDQQDRVNRLQSLANAYKRRITLVSQAIQDQRKYKPRVDTMAIDQNKGLRRATVARLNAVNTHIQTQGVNLTIDTLVSMESDYIQQPFEVLTCPVKSNTKTP